MLMQAHEPTANTTGAGIHPDHRPNMAQSLIEVCKQDDGSAGQAIVT